MARIAIAAGASAAGTIGVGGSPVNREMMGSRGERSNNDGLRRRVNPERVQIVA